MRVLIDPGTHHLLNLGDAVMLEVCVGRLRSAWPDARIEVLTVAPELLARHCPGAVAVDAEGRYRWLNQPHAGDEPARARRLVSLSRRLPGVAGRGAARAVVATRRRRDPAVVGFLESMARADLFVISGRGALTDAFTDEAFALLAELETALALGVPAAMMGQGLGPLESPRLRERAASVLPDVSLIAVREGRVGPRLLGELGVPAERVVVTGDDCLQAVPAPDAARQPGARVGVNLRAADYAALERGPAEALVEEVTRTAADIGAEVVPIVISRHPHEDDRRTLAAAGAPETTAELIAQVARCRVVVSGSYHAALLALGQGVPAVGVYLSAYYRDKLLGLRERFGPGFRVLDLEQPDAERRLADAVREAWDDAPAARPDLLAATAGQVEAGREAYARLVRLAESG